MSNRTVSTGMCDYCSRRGVWLYDPTGLARGCFCPKHMIMHHPEGMAKIKETGELVEMWE